MREILAALAAILMLCGYHSAQAAECGPRDDVLSVLANQYGEVVQAQAMSGDGRMMELTANPVTGTWTALMTTPDGQACLVAGGDRYQTVKPGDPA